MTLESTVGSELAELRDRLLHGNADPVEVANRALAQANRNADENVYLALDRDWTVAEAAALPGKFPDPAQRPALYGIPVSLKDCFDLAGFPTTCGSKFYAELNGAASADSWIAEKLRSQGAVITGKTHLHQLAYGITGENADYGDCAQPRSAAVLTGGSSSGAAASVQESSAAFAIGTDTGGSIRVPAALCGLAGYRSSLGLGDWRGGAHLAPSFDTIGWLFRDIRDAPFLAHAVLDLPLLEFQPDPPPRIGSVDDSFLHDCALPVRMAFEAFKAELKELGVSIGSLNTAPWANSFDVFSPIQAHEAAMLHAGHFEKFEPNIAERLNWGASISTEDLIELRAQHEQFRKGFDRLFDTYDFLVMPCAPVSFLLAGADHSAARKKTLRYTTPASLAGTPVVTLPLEGAGVQLIARHGSDPRLLAFAAWLGAERQM
jgi:Asp-tRNA(Asn)/Glu-tRNA(Gln) amidotransferase A subunit family amidase